MKTWGRAFLTILLLQVAWICLAPVGVSADALSDLHLSALESIAGVVEVEIEAGRIPGAVIVIGHRGKIVYHRAFGYRALEPKREAMTEDTLFDLASLTKVVATTTAVMQLVEAGKLCLDEPVGMYWPAFRNNGKDEITVQELLTHYSGLRPDLSRKAKGSGYRKALNEIVAERPVLPPGTGFLYSDINFEVLGELVRRVSGQRLEAYSAQHIFKPLGMKDTGFKLSPAQRKRTAPTTYWNGKWLRGTVHDPTARAMGGVSGHAGLFSSASDLATFAQMMLDGGSAKAAQILSPLTIEKMTTPQTPAGQPVKRGLGWDIDSPLASDWNGRLAEGYYGHTGYTGTSLWLDPGSRTYVIVLTNRLHPYDKGDVRRLRTQVAALVAEALGRSPADPSAAGRDPTKRASDSAGGNRVETGVDVLVADGFAPLAGRRVGLITNHTGLDFVGRRTIDLLCAAPGVRLVALFSPEHGLDGDADNDVPSSREPTTGLPVYSLYGPVKRPTPAMLDGLDALVFDIQDVGARFYTYITTMAYAMEAVSSKGIPIYVLDRPNPISASVVQGPILDEDARSFTGYFPLPVRYGLTIGELAGLLNVENHIAAELHVVKMRGYRRSDWYDDTGLRWIGPSPNLHLLRQVALYPGVALVEGTNVSVGRGTNTPFEVLGAPWIDANKLASYLSVRRIQAVSFEPVDFTPHENPFQDQLCHGVRIVSLDRNQLDVPGLGIEIASALYRLYPKEFRLDKTLSLVGARWVLQAIREDEDPQSIVQRWQVSMDKFLELRAKYLLY